MTIIDLNEWKKQQEPHMDGEAKCIQCGHEWAHVAPLGSDPWFECPSCGLMKGAFKYNCEPEVFWQCNCKNTLFVLGNTGIVCTLCGLYQEGYDGNF